MSTEKVKELISDLCTFKFHLYSTLVLRMMLKGLRGGFPGGPVVKNPSCNVGDAVLIPGWKTGFHMLQSMLHN